MIYKVVTYFFLPCMILALVLSFVGVSSIEFDNSYYNFMQNVNSTFNKWSFTIPNIPKIKDIEGAEWKNVKEFFTFMKWLGQVFVNIINGFISVINVLLMVVNVVIHLIQFIISLIYCIINFRDTMATNSIILGLNSL